MIRSTRVLLTTALLLPFAARAQALVAEKVASYAESHMGKRVERGECWDLAATALNNNGAHWDGFYGFGEVVDTARTAVQRGDIVQFEGVVVEQRTSTSMSRDSMGKHTAIVLRVLGPGRYELAHQNFGPDGRKVSRYTLEMADVVKGRIQFYRPVDG